MNAFRLAPLFLAIAALSACGSKEEGSGGSVTSGTPVKAVPAPAGTSWADHVEATADGVRMGNPDAAIKLIEYGSYTCPHCRDFSAEAHEAIEKDYVNTGKVSFEYRNMVRDPLDIAVSLIAHCGGPEPFFPLSTQLFANQEAMITALQAAGDAAYKAAVTSPPEQRFVKLGEVANLIEFAKQRGLPEAKVRACLADSKAAERLAKISQDVLDKYPQFPGTPSFFINGTLLDDTASWAKLQPRLRDAGA